MVMIFLSVDCKDFIVRQQAFFFDNRCVLIRLPENIVQVAFGMFGIDKRRLVWLAASAGAA
ncbi:MAG: hypothetical protein WBO82_04760, partial [Neisseria sp.]